MGMQFSSTYDKKDWISSLVMEVMDLEESVY